MEMIDIEHLREEIKKNERESFIKAPEGAIGEKSPSQKCYYMDGIKCVFSAKDASLCARCPYGYAYCFNQIVKKVYNKIISLFIFFRA